MIADLVIDDFQDRRAEDLSRGVVLASGRSGNTRMDRMSATLAMFRDWHG